MAGNYQAPAVDSITLAGGLTVDTLLIKPWQITVSGSDDGLKWEQLGIAKGDSLPGNSALADFLKRFPRPAGQKMTAQQMSFMRRFATPNRRVMNFGFKLPQAVHYKYYRLNGDDPGAKIWSVNDLTFYNSGKAAPIGGPYNFTSAWKSAGSGTEWVYIDLGAECTFNHIKLSWIRPAAQGSVQVSGDAESWKDIAALPASAGLVTDLPLTKEMKGRYVRVLMNKTSQSRKMVTILSEMEVMWYWRHCLPVAHAQDANQNKTVNLTLPAVHGNCRRGRLLKKMVRPYRR